LNEESLKTWKIAGIVASCAILLVVPLYLLKINFIMPIRESGPSPPTFVGRDKCQPCHKEAYETWIGSHHDLAMDVATDSTVLGDFNDVTFVHDGITSRFYRQDGKFYVHTPGPDGEMADFEITHTFGVFPLQQYLSPFPGGRLQCLTIAWDSNEKKWFHLYPEDTHPQDWLYWTNPSMNWNGMCAECHSTRLLKRYDYATKTYQTTWSEIDVSCESCHGPGSHHVEWADKPEMGRTELEGYGLIVQTGEMTATEQVELCARCHARRLLLGDYSHESNNLLDAMLPTLLEEGLYYPDGQILDEVYVYGSFVQSKMYRRGVKCNDCHDVHSIKRILEGNDLCLQCHQADLYDSYDHHFHKKEFEGQPSEGALCEKCHMPGLYYMGNDYRLDHSIRNPRPDLSLELNVPNSCNMKTCHDDKSIQWSVDYMIEWYGTSRKPHYGSVFAAARGGLPEAQEGLLRIADDNLMPTIVRATALSLLEPYPIAETISAYEIALMDSVALVRHAAVASLPLLSQEEVKRLIVPMLYDSVKAVRMEAARYLVGVQRDQLDERQLTVFYSGLEEYKDAMQYSTDMPSSCMNLGNVAMDLDQVEFAGDYYRSAIQIDREFYPAKINLAMLYNQLGRNDDAESLYRDVLAENPEFHEVSYSLGLLLAEMNRYEEAADFLARASTGLPERTRIYYNLGLVLQLLDRKSEAESALRSAIELEPYNLDYLYALADHYIKRGMVNQAKAIAQRMKKSHPDNPLGQNILNFLEGL
jgi:tetratricopeptide (TPR) repeat protein